MNKQTTYCYHCSALILLEEAENWKGHHACKPCVETIAKRLNMKPDYRPIPRQDMHHVKPEDLQPGDGFQYQIGMGWSEPLRFDRRTVQGIEAIGICGEKFTVHQSHTFRRAKFSAPAPGPAGSDGPDDSALNKAHCTAFIDPAFSEGGYAAAGVHWTLPPELLESPDAGKIIAECREICEMLLKKNRAYGSSFRKPLGIYSKLSPVEAINARLDDKLARTKEAKDFTEDTDCDTIGYLILKRIVMKEERENLCPSTVPAAELKNEFNPNFRFTRADIEHTARLEPVKLPPGSTDHLPVVPVCNRRHARSRT